MIIYAMYGSFLGMYFGSRSAFFSESFPKSIKCTGVSVSLSFAHAIFGGFSNIIMEFCVHFSKICGIIPFVVIICMAIFAMSMINDRTGMELE